MPLTISSTGIKGKLVMPVNRVVNLSSCPTGYVNIMLARIPSMPSNVMMLDVIPTMMYIFTTNKLVSNHGRQNILLIVDEQSKNTEIFKKTLRQYCGFHIVDVITMSNEKSSNKNQKTSGIVQTIASHHHTDEMLRSIGVVNNTLDNNGNVMSYTICITPGSFVNTVCGLTVCCNYIGSNFTIQTVPIQYGYTWLKIDVTEFIDKWTLTDKNTVDMKKVSTRQHWRRSIGYTTGMTTECGYKQIILKENNNTDYSGVFTKFVEALIKLGKFVCKLLKPIINKIYKMMGWKTDNKEGPIKIAKPKGKATYIKKKKKV